MRKCSKPINFGGVEYFLVKSREWADFYEGKHIDGTSRSIKVSKFTDTCAEDFFRKHGPEDFTEKELLSIATTFYPRKYEILPEFWAKIFQRIYKSL